MIGTTLAHYEIKEKLGAGGMGDVYRARDTKLDRDVALKILPAEMANDSDRRMRFEREAKAVAALNHPNIVTIHAVEEVDGHHFIAMELVDGETLADIIAKGPLSLERIFDIAVPLTEAMTAAHAKGITHRDLKPANVMIAQDGQLKVLDFGLAKLYEAPDPSEAMTIAADSVTQEGRILGTVAYMSPEQAEGKQVGPESDVFSLGVMLFEMATGERPFKGDTAMSTISSILKEDPPSLTEIKDTLPRHLSRIVKRCLAKSPDRRYQGARDLRNDLLELKEEFDSGEQLITGSSIHMMAAPGPKTAGAPKWLWPVLAVAVVAVVAVVFKSQFAPSSSRDSRAESSQAMQVTRLTATGKSTEAAISPDGKYVAHIIRDEGKYSMWVTHVTTMSSVEIVPGADAYIWDPAFSPEGDFIYFCRDVAENDVNELLRIPVLGGQPVKVLTDISSTVSFSPDGKQFCFMKSDQETSESVLIVANVDGSGQREVVRRGFPTPINEGPAWSPDGKILAAPIVSLKESFFGYIAAFDVATGQEAQITEPKEWFQISELVWHPSGNSLVFNATDDLIASQLFEASYPGGAIRRITNDVNQYNGVGVTEDGQILVAGIDEAIFNVWVTETGRNAQPQKITSALKGAYTVDDWTEEGIFVVSDADGADVWRMNPDGSNSMRLTHEGLNFDPNITPDGKEVVFTSTRGGGINLWKMGVDGGSPQQISSGTLEVDPTVTPDGEWIVYMGGGIQQSIYKIPYGGGDPVLLVGGSPNFPRVSPDGQSVLYQAYHPPAGKSQTLVISINGGEPTSVLDIQSGNHEWSPDGTAVTYIKTDNGVGNIWSQALAGGESEQLTFFDEGTINRFAWSPDGSRLAVSRGHSTSDVILVKDYH